MSESTLIMRDISLQRRIRLQRYEFYLIYTNKKCRFFKKDLFPEKLYRDFGHHGQVVRRLEQVHSSSIQP